MNINEFIATLPSNVVTGESVIIPDDFIRRIFTLSNLKDSDTFYHLGIGNNPSSLIIAKKEFKVKKAVGIDVDPTIIDEISAKTSQIEDIFLVEADVKVPPFRSYGYILLVYRRTNQ